MTRVQCGFMGLYERLLQGNSEWRSRKLVADPEFFSRLVSQQSPTYLWIGCSDSRVPANEITGTDPGEIFVHRNIANLVVTNDLNLLSVLNYAVSILKVKHVIVCGHYGCGGVRAAALRDPVDPILSMWLKNIRDVVHENSLELDRISDEEQRVNRVVELNVASQVQNLMRTDIIQDAWRNQGGPDLHGWVYSIADGILHPLVEVPAGSHVDDAYVRK